MEKTYEMRQFRREVIKGSAAGLIITLVGVLVFALAIDLFSIPDGAIMPVNQVIKLISVFLGCLFSVRGEKGFLKGLLIGIIFSLTTALIFSMISGKVTFAGIMIDALCGGVMGMISGAIVVNLPLKN